MDIWRYLLVFLFGTIIGSFLNVVIYRYNTGQKVTGRSRCLNCGKTLYWYELVPLVSFFVQRARCRKCRSKISWQYPLVELGTGLLFLLICREFHFSPALALFYAAIWSLLVVIMVYDLRHKIIPDHFVYAFSGLALLKLIIFPDGFWADKLLAGLVFFLFFAALWRFSRGRWMGFGDAKLALGVGLLLGLRGALSAIIFAFWIGAVVGALLILFGRLLAWRQSVTIKTEIPFAPFIILGLALNLFFYLDVLLLIGQN